MKHLINILSMLFVLSIFGCTESDKVSEPGSSTSSSSSGPGMFSANNPIALDINPANGIKNLETIIRLDYIDLDGDAAVSCKVSALKNIVILTNCNCDQSGICTVGFLGHMNYVGAASFNYTVLANGDVSNSASSTYNIISSTGNAPVANSIMPTNGHEELEKFITLDYTDPNGDYASSCFIYNLSGVTKTTSCSCNIIGTCIVGVTGNAGITGSVNFDFVIVANSDTSNGATALFTLDNSDDAPVSSNINPPALTEDIQATITLGYTDVDGDLATSCSVSNFSNVTETNTCSCTVAGVCTVGITGTGDYFGVASFDYIVIANSFASNISTASFTVFGINDDPVAADVIASDVTFNTSNIITLAYTDAENESADTCTVSNLSNVTEAIACSCSGVLCSATMKPTLDYVGAVSFDFIVSDGVQNSNTASVSYSIVSADAACIASAIPASSPFQSGSGNVADPYIICSAAQLQSVNDSTKNLSKIYQLGDNIDLSSIPLFEPIGNCGGDYLCHNGDESPFTGSFDGNGKVISNLIITKDESGVGLFGHTKNAVLSDIKVSSATITVNGSSNPAMLYAVGGIIGSLFNSNISNLYFNGAINITNNASSIVDVGGIVGTAVFHGATFSGLKVDSGTTINVAPDTNSNPTSISSIGGLIGYGEGVRLSRSYAKGNITIPNSGTNDVIVEGVGGLIGYAETQSSFLFEADNVFSSLDITIDAKGNVSNVGQGFGATFGDSPNPVVITDSYFSGNLSITDTSATNGSNTGAVVGYAEEGLTTNNVFVDVNIVVSKTNLSNNGNLVGLFSDTLTTTNTFSTKAACEGTCTSSTVPMAFQGFTGIGYEPINSWSNYSTNWLTQPGAYPELLHSGLVAKSSMADTVLPAGTNNIILQYRDENGEEATSCVVSNYVNINAAPVPSCT